jgi:hypothetical protein
MMISFLVFDPSASILLLLFAPLPFFFSFLPGRLAVTFIWRPESAAQLVRGLVSETKTSQQVDGNLNKCNDQAILCIIPS